MNGMRGFSAAAVLAMLLAAPVCAEPAPRTLPAVRHNDQAAARPHVSRPQPPRNRKMQAMNPMMQQTTHEIMMPAPGMPMPPPANGASATPVSPPASPDGDRGR